MSYKTCPLFSIAALLLVAGCAASPQEKAGSQQPLVSSSASSVYQYRCESGETIAAAYPDTQSAAVQYKADHYAMQNVISASGARYAGGGLEWWTKGSGAGSEGTLLRHEADGTSGEILERCTAL